MTRNNNTVKNMKVKKYNDYNSREEKTAKLEARKQARKDRNWSKYDHERY